jgi:hypothetical protein
MKHMSLVVMAFVAVVGPVMAVQDDGARRVREILASRRITLDFQGARLSEVIAYFQEFSGLNFHIDAEAGRDRDEDRIAIKVKDVSLRTALKLVLNPRDLGCVYRDGVLVVTTKARLAASTVTRVYDIRDLQFQLQDFPGPKFELDYKMPGIDAGLLGQHEDPKGGFDSETLIDLIKTNLDPRSWEDGAEVSISVAGGLLVVSQSRSIHEELARFLDLLRQYK